MRITKIIVTKLFGIFDHEIPLNLDDRITIIHAPNGFGKTIMLRMLHGLFNGSYSIFFSIPFEKFRVEFDDNANILVEKEEFKDITQDNSFYESDDYDIMQKSKLSSSVVRFNIFKEGINRHKPFLYSYGSMEKFRDQDWLIDTKIPNIERIGLEEWIYIPTGEILSIYDIYDRFWYLLGEKYKIPEWWTVFQKTVDIRFIQTQRLQDFFKDLHPAIPALRKRAIPISAVVEYAKDLKEEIQQKLAESASLSQSIDRAFLERLLQQMERKNQSNPSIDMISSKLEALEEKRYKLIEAGLIDKEADLDFRIPETTDKDTKKVLAVYVEDAEKKLSIFDDLAEKINLFREMINKRFLYKKMFISKDRGFYFITPDGKTLPLHALSSGEQHELVLLYQLLFKTKPNTVILIDEPEISLHVAWQIEFLKDLQKIVDLVELDVILATHSPQIINDRWDLTVELESPVSSYETISHTR